MIIFAKTINNRVCAYDDKKNQIINEEGKLYNYTDSTVVIERNNNYYIYNERGILVSSYNNDINDISNIAGMFL